MKYPALALILLLSFLPPLFADELQRFVETYLSLSKKDISDIRTGKVIAKLLETHDKREVAVAAITRVDAPQDFVVNAIRDITSLKKGKEVLQIGKFATLAPEDLKRLTLEDGDIESIKDCKLRDCDMKLPAVWIEQFEKLIVSSTSDPSDAINQDFRQMLAEYVKDYLVRGNKALVEYRNKETPLRLADEFQSILEQSSYLKGYAADFTDYLKEYPDKTLDGTDHFVYWSKEKFGFRAVISLTHVTVYQRPLQDGGVEHLIASKQLYASHYFEGSLGMTIVMDGEKEGTSYVVYINRSRVDALAGFLSSLRRAIALPRIRKNVENFLVVFHTRLEDMYREKQ